MNELITIVGVDQDVVDPERDRAIDDLTYQLDEADDPDLLVRHAGHPHPWVRQAVAGNPATPQETLTILAGDEAPVVRRNAAITCADPESCRSCPATRTRRPPGPREPPSAAWHGGAGRRARVGPEQPVSLLARPDAVGPFAASPGIPVVAPHQHGRTGRRETAAHGQSMAHRTGSTVIRLADRLCDAAARHSCDGPVAIPLAALATGILLLGAPPTLRNTFLHRLSDPAHTHDARAVWRAAAVDYPYLSGSLETLIGWFSGETPEHQMQALAQCFGALTAFDLKGAAESRGVGGDLLGPVYSQLRGDRSRQRTGAFYTPPDLSALLSAITGPRPGDRVHEPACGTGGMMLAAVRSMRDRGLDPNRCTWTLNDIDPVAVALAAVNMATHGVRTVHLRCGDALAQRVEAAGRDRLSEALAAPHTDPT